MCKIYLWKHLKLAEDFKNKHVSEKQRFVYFTIQKLIYFIVGGVSTILLAHLCIDKDSKVAEGNVGDIIKADSFIALSTITILIILAVIFKGYIENKKRDNLDFVVRYLCLELPVGIKTAVFGIAASFIAVVIYAIISAENMDPSSFPPVITLIILLGSYLVYYRMMIEAIKIASSGKEKAKETIRPKTTSKAKKTKTTRAVSKRKKK